MDIGAKIKFYRKQAGMKQKDLAAAIGVASTTVTGYEKGYREPNAIMIIKIAQALGVTGDDLLGIDIKEKPSADNSEELLDAEIIERLTSLTEEELARVDAFVQGLLAARKA